jgi:hypothetical protein
VLQIVSFQDLWSIDPGYRRTLSVFAAGYSTYVAYTCVVVTLLYWYTVMLTLRASVERKPNREQVRNVMSAQPPHHLLCGWAMPCGSACGEE